MLSKYCESWGKDVADIAQAHIQRIRLLLDKHDSQIDTTFKDFLLGLQNNLNPNIDKEDAIEMLAQHLITKPVFDALFEDYEFVKSNPVSQIMEGMMEILDRQTLDEEKTKLEKFYESVRERASGIDNAEGKQKIILELYETFFKSALPLEVEKLGIVYTPTECVDFIIHSVEHLMQKEFGKSLADENVHIIDGFTGTGTFVVRLLQSGIISKNDLLRKYSEEIHANEINLLTYYIAAINIEETLHSLLQLEKYEPFEGIVLTDTFQLYEDVDEEDELSLLIKEGCLHRNSERAEKQKDLNITVAISNPPYSTGQRSANDEAQNVKYAKLDKRIADTYAVGVTAKNKNSLYDSYIKAFRWASDRIDKRGIIGFITNGAFIDNLAMSGFRRSLLEEFTSVYIFNLRGNQRTKGEESRKEGGKIFGSGSRTPVSITFLIKNPEKPLDKAIHYHDIGDYLTREQKLGIISNYESVDNVEWSMIRPDSNNDWINKKSEGFSNFYPANPAKKFSLTTKSVFTLNSMGFGTSRDAWIYGYNSHQVLSDMETLVTNYNLMQKDFQSALRNGERVENFKKYIDLNPKKIKWSSSMDSFFKRGEQIQYQSDRILEVAYRPFCKQFLYMGEKTIHRRGQQESIFCQNNPVPCICYSRGTKPSALMSNIPVDLHYVGDVQVYPLYWFEKDPFGEMKRYEGISQWFLRRVRSKYEDQHIKTVDIFYYIYGLLNSEEFLKKYSSDLAKESLRVPLVSNLDDFLEISRVGRELGDLHSQYEYIQPINTVEVINDAEHSYLPDTLWNQYKVNKMKYPKKRIMGNNGKLKSVDDKSSIIFNDNIRIRNIPDEAYEYVINGRSAIDWVIEFYQVKTDKTSGITNNPNDWSEHVGNPRYILDLLLSVIALSVKTVELRKQLPEIKYE